MKQIKDIKTIDRVAQMVERYGEKELKFYSKYDYFRTEDGLIVELTGARARGITREIYFSDEDAQGNYRTGSDIAPTKEILKEIFFKENLDNLTEITKRQEERPYKKIYISKPNWVNSEVRCFLLRDEADIDRRHDIERLATDEEIKWLKGYEDEQRKEMTERLEKYWKRYSNKVGIRTYWADR